MLTKKNCIKLTIVIAGVMMLFGVSGSQAFNVETSESGLNATGILNLDVGGTFYNLDFLNGSADDPTIYGPSYNFDFDDVGAEAAAQSVVSALNTVDSVVFVGPGGLNSDDTFYIGFSENLSLVNAKGANHSINDWFLISGDSAIDKRNEVVWAKFNPVPIPAAVWLFGGGLVGLVGLRRRFKN